MYIDDEVPFKSPLASRVVKANLSEAREIFVHAQPTVTDRIKNYIDIQNLCIVKTVKIRQ
ncbi:13497_t:CDS:1, partial [Acaulospora colombiana]